MYKINRNNSYHFRSDLLLVLEYGIMVGIMDLLVGINGINTLESMVGSAVLIKTVPGLTKTSDAMTENST